MNENDRQTRSRLMELFERHGFHPRGDLGQNFLIDLNLVEYIAEQAQLGPNDVALEIGTGTGGLTTYLAQKAAAVVSVEVDANIYRVAQSVTAGYPNVTLLNCDALKNKNTIEPQVLATVQEKLDEAPGRRLVLSANLPYNIATPVISNLVATELPWSRMIVTIQYELAQRMAAKPGRSHYGALSVWLQAQCYVKLLKRLPPSVFWPRPKVNSGIVRLVPNPYARERIENRPFLQDFLRRVFHQRRKFIRSVLVGMYRKELEKTQIDAILQSLSLKENARAEELDVPTLVELGNRLWREIQVL
jgi:16S rRNA (adenine1518-N6/adenine1519-N6)-dimethyltransferase